MYRIETGDYSGNILYGARTHETAAVKSFKMSPPKNPGALTRIRKTTKDARGRWKYVDTSVLLKKAGYEVE